MTGPPVTAHLWLIGPDARCSGTASEHSEILSTEEKKRAAAFATPELRIRFIRRRWFLRVILGDYLKMTPSKISIVADRNNKPVLDTGKPGFSLSASGGWIAVALTSGHNIGVDIEEKRKIPDALKMATPFFHPDESLTLCQTAPEAQNAAFLRCWTRKEAILKAHGAGLRAGLGSVNVGFSSLPKEGVTVSLESRTFILQDISTNHGIVAAMAIEGEHFSIVHETLPHDA